MRADPEHLDAYLARLGLEREPPSVEALFRLHEAHAEQIAYETLWIQLGERRGIDQGASLALLSEGRRGGYCYHLNGAMGLALEALGYDVTRHVAGVYGHTHDDRELAMTNHLVLTVAGLPTDGNPEGRWYFDVGLGDALHSPLPLRAGTFVQPPFTVSLEPGTDGLGEWHLSHDPDGSFAGSNWREGAVGMETFADRHEWLSTSPESGFVKFLVVQRRDADGVDIIKGCTLRRLGAGAFDTTITTEAELREVLTDRFRLDLSDVDPDAMAALWSRMWRAHEQWEAAGRP
jgi:N-hydroxyarylamine O-acetyltransferase